LRPKRKEILCICFNGCPNCINDKRHLNPDYADDRINKENGIDISAYYAQDGRIDEIIKFIDLGHDKADGIK